MWKVGRLSGKLQDSLESFQTVWKVSRQAGNFPDSEESFQTVWKVLDRLEKFPDSVESFQTAWKVSRRSGKFYVAKAISALLAHMCRKNDLRIPFGKFLRMKFC